MKAITIWQPWASLMACGAKQFETRGWATSYRGPIAIHAAVKKPPKQRDMSPEVFHAIAEVLAKYYGAWRYDWHLDGTKINPDGTDNGFNMPLGAVIATGELVGCHKIVSVGWTGASKRRIAWTDGELAPHYPSENEILFGDWTPGRYAWEIKNVQMLPNPIPAKGKQRLWNWEAAL